MDPNRIAKTTKILGSAFLGATAKAQVMKKQMHCTSPKLNTSVLQKDRR